MDAITNKFEAKEDIKTRINNFFKEVKFDYPSELIGFLAKIKNENYKYYPEFFSKIVKLASQSSIYLFFDKDGKIIFGNGLLGDTVEKINNALIIKNKFGELNPSFEADLKSYLAISNQFSETSDWRRIVNEFSKIELICKTPDPNLLNTDTNQTIDYRHDFTFFRFYLRNGKVFEGPTILTLKKYLEDPESTKLKYLVYGPNLPANEPINQ